MLEITIGNCQKRDLETVIDPNNSQYFWVNRKKLETESRRNCKLFSIGVKTHRDKNIGKN